MRTNAKTKIDWRRLKVIAFESDDWCGPDRNGWVDADTYRRGMAMPEIAEAYKDNVWNKGMNTLESVEDMETLFRTLLRTRGGDGRPPVFTAVCFLANPDFEAIRANDFTRYADIGIDKPYPALWRSRGDIVAKAREGEKLGVWSPESHNTRAGGHFNPHLWVKFLREKKDKALNLFFSLNMVGKAAEITTNTGMEFDSMGHDELEEWVRGGTRYFENAFGRVPRVSGVGDARARCKVLEEVMERLLARNGVTTVLNAVNKDMGEINAALGLTYIKRNANFEPALTRMEQEKSGRWRVSDNQEPWSDSCYREILSAWENNQPAIVNSHRVNYTSLDPDKKAESFRQLARLLEKIQSEHPDAVYRNSHEIGAMYRE